MPKGLKRALIATLIAVALYALLGFLVLPAIALHLANGQLERYVSAPAMLEGIRFNPFTLETTLSGLSIGEPEQLGFDRLYLDFEWRSLWERRLYLADMDAEGLRGEALIGQDGAFNLQQLFETPEPEPAEQAPSSGLFPLYIERLAIRDAYLHFQDLSHDEPIELTYEDLDLELAHLGTQPDNQADVSLLAKAPGGGTLEWTGQLGLAPFNSQGTLSIAGLALGPLAPYVRQAAAIRLQEGALALKTDYRLSVDDSTSFALSNTELKVAPLVVADAQGAPLLRLDRLHLAGAAVDLEGRRITLGTLGIEGLVSHLERGEDGTLNWQRLMATDPAPGADAATETGAAPQAPWRVIVNEGTLADARLTLADRVPEHDVELAVGPLDLSVSRLDTGGQAPFELALATTVGKQGSLKIDGTLAPDAREGRFTLESQDLDLRIAQSYLSPFLHLELRSGLLDSALALELTGIDPLAFTVTGRADVEQLHTLDTFRQRDLVRWQRLGLEGIAYRYPNALSIDHVELEKPYARVVINPDQSTNLSELRVADKDGSTAREASEPASDREPTGDDTPFALHIGGITLKDGSADFADLSLRPVFATSIEQLAGQIGTLDTQAQQPAKVTLAGRVDRYAPVSIDGSLTPFDPLRSLDLTARFNQLELTTLSPYTSKFAGYRIQRGRLNLDLHYRIENGLLNAENHVVIEQLQLGEKVESPDAVDLPIQLAVALLKDSSGTISLRLPVQGDLRNPQFDVMPVVWQTLRNLVVRAVKSPFKFLGGLVAGNQPDLSEVPFAPGSSTLQPPATQRLDALAKALTERPVLKLEVEGRSTPAEDGVLIAQARLDREYRYLWYRMQQERGEKVPADALDIVVPDEEKPALLDAMYRTRLKQQPPTEWDDLDDPARQGLLRAALIEHWSDNASLLRRLSQARAASIKGYLVDSGGLDAQRIYLLAPSLAPVDDEPQVTSLLHLGSL
ncbi:DUF748 domain-containing protein [Stutzerimonas urumqiensis]|uniref:DUF748 domain-containing protein n=1 Tax=Stutzerimonas urumqiensis TaxID=638269 RepID=UPI003BA9E7A2